MVIKTQVELNNFINSKIKYALQLTMEELLDKLHEYIMEEVYDDYNPSWYSRTYELMNNWSCTKPIIVGDLVESILSFSEPISHSGADDFQHGMSWLDNQSFLEVVNDGRIGNICGFPQLGGRPFWTKFEMYCSANFSTIFKLKLNQLGLKTRG